MLQRRLAWPLRKDEMQIREVFHIFTSYKKSGKFYVMYILPYLKYFSLTLVLLGHQIFEVE